MPQTSFIPLDLSILLNTPKSGPTLMMPGKPLNPDHRNNSTIIYTLVSEKTFGMDYFAKKDGQVIIKHDFFRFLADKSSFIQIKRSENPHHHIEVRENILDRLKSVSSLPRLKV